MTIFVRYNKRLQNSLRKTKKKTIYENIIYVTHVISCAYLFDNILSDACLYK